MNRTMYGPGLQIVGSGFPHSEIRGSKLVRSSPRLNAAYHVLHRLSVPRHPPNALTTLDRSHDRCPPLGRGRPWVRAVGHRRKKTSLLHVPVGTGGQAQSLWGQHHKGMRLAMSQRERLFTISDNSPETPMGTRQKGLLNTRGMVSGGARRDRTDDLMLAKHALSQLSYGPNRLLGLGAEMVGLGGLEPPTSRLSSARSNQLSYKPEARNPQRPAGRCDREERETKTAKTPQGEA